jgi:hypothetical protein
MDGPPASGTSGSFAGLIQPGGLVYDYTNGVLSVNEGSSASPYYTPVGFDQRPLFGVWTDFRDNGGEALADTDAAHTIPGSGLRVFGDGLAETDSGLVVQTAGEGGKAGRITTNAANAKGIAIGMDASVMQPDQHQLLVLDVRLTNVSAITLRRMFMGFLGTAADGLVSPATGSTTTITLVQDDLAGLFFDVGLTDADRLFAPHNKSDEAASIATTATGVDTGTDIATAGTYQRLRVEISAGGDMRCFVNKALVTTIVDALDADEEVTPVLCVFSTSSAVKSIDVSHFATWAYRLSTQ